MPLYDVKVEETRHYSVTYRVEADNPEEALELAEQGDTVSESDEHLEGVLSRNANRSSVSQVPLFVRVEYDTQYYGGDYDDVGDVALLPEKGLTDENINEMFQKHTGIDPQHIIHYSFDELFTEDGDPAD